MSKEKPVKTFTFQADTSGLLDETNEEIQDQINQQIEEEVHNLGVKEDEDLGDYILETGWEIKVEVTLKKLPKEPFQFR